MVETEDSAAAMEGVDTMDTTADSLPSPPTIITPGPSTLTKASSSSSSTTTTTTTTTANPSTDTDPPLSKSARKKLLKTQLLQATHESWKAHKREKRKARKAALKERKISEAMQKKRPASPDEGERGGESSSAVVAPPAKKVKRTLEPITIILDCAFDDLMAEKEINSLSSQIIRCYSVNRASPHQVSLQITSLTGRLLERYKTTFSSQHLRWKNVTSTSSEYEVTPDLVYLTADSPNTITELEPGKRYIIGGIVDKNRHKMLCYNKAVGQGIQTAKLPIGDYVKMASRFVLTTNQVVEIMIRWLECKDWEKAFMEVIPQRKMAAPKGAEGEASNAGEPAVKEEEPEDDGGFQGEAEPEPDSTTQGTAGGVEDMDVEPSPVKLEQPHDDLEIPKPQDDGRNPPAEGNPFRGTITIHSFVPPPLRL